MSPQATRQTPAGRAYLDLQSLARRTGRPTDELHQLYALEGFLDRLTRSPHVGMFVLKGGVLLAAFDTRRPTRDIDLAARSLNNDPEVVKHLIAEVLEIDTKDGLCFDRGSVTAASSRDDAEYNGVRVIVAATLARARVRFHVDVNVGDPIVPAPEAITLSRLLGGELTVTGYPLEMVLAEKIVTAVQRGNANTRCEISLISPA